jgi:site-specific DNA-methyltransferase (cytosine-N4-specific)
LLKARPSGHDISASFGKDNGGAIPSNLLQFPNTESNGRYLEACKAAGTKGHPARFPAKLPEFFIKFLTEPGDLVVDIFAGSNTTGEVAELEGRYWLAFEEVKENVAASAFRFLDRSESAEQASHIFSSIMSAGGLDLRGAVRQKRLLP